MHPSNPLFAKFQHLVSASGHFDLAKATMQEKLELLEALIKDQGEGNTYIVVTNKDGADKMMLSAGATGSDISA